MHYLIGVVWWCMFWFFWVFDLVNLHSVINWVSYSCTYGISLCTIDDVLGRQLTLGTRLNRGAPPEDVQQVNRDIFDRGILGIPVERDCVCDMYSDEAVIDKSQITVIEYLVPVSYCINSGDAILHSPFVAVAIRGKTCHG